MSIRLRVDPSSATPLWAQIEAQLRQLIGGGRLAPGVALPSVRVLASELMINPATVARAYARLCDESWLVVRRGEGTFVADAPPAVPRSERTRALREAAAAYVATAHGLGATASEALDAVDAALGRSSRRAEEGRR